MRRGSVASPKEQETGHEEIASGCPMGGSDWVFGKISSPEGLSSTGQAAQGCGLLTSPGCI